MTITLLKAISVIIILAIMVLLLISVNHFLSGNFSSSEEDMDRMRDDIKDSDRVISNENIFNELVRVKSKKSL